MRTEAPLVDSPDVPGEAAPAPLPSEARDALIAAYFCRSAETLGIPRSLAQIYTALFLSPGPMAFEEIVARSGLSKASASTGLRDLERLHGVERIVVPADRRSFYQAQLSLRRLLGAFVAETIRPGLADGARLLQEAQVDLDHPDVTEHLRSRVRSLATWHARAAEILPVLSVLAAPSPLD